ncbi:MAG: family 10 glycosylhydrolase, partial [Ignavibacteria bacterium]|nr:family 10 glycosylhydrolase [Ignavibacteria bacterium]
VRTECDALYDSQIEPWSFWLTEEQGKAPKPYFDPLDFAISEAHSRGMELHAWFNPYRAVKLVGDYKASLDHIAQTHPEWILKFGNYHILDPGNPNVRRYILSIITDVLTRYDIDGIHFDDYFYPYSPRVTNEDSLTFVKYHGEFNDIHEWRRNNINVLMAEIYDIIKAVKPKVKFGISPFGIVENKYAGTSGFDAYNILYCDPLTWLKNKSVDYINPQLYWEMNHDKAPYSKLLPWWTTVTEGRHLYIGLYSGRFVAPRYNGNKNELYEQLKMNRKYKEVQGAVFFSAKSITNNVSGLADSLKNVWYKYPALLPTMPWKDAVLPLPPKNLQLKEDSTGVTIFWDKPEPASDGEEPVGYVIYRFNSTEQINLNDPRNIIHITFGNRTRFKDTFNVSPDSEFVYMVTSIDKLHNESEGNQYIVFSKKSN